MQMHSPQFTHKPFLCHPNLGENDRPVVEFPTLPPVEFPQSAWETGNFRFIPGSRRETASVRKNSPPDSNPEGNLI